MLEFVITTQPSRRIVCLNEATYIYLWPYLFSREVPGALQLCRWAARRGAAVHGAVRLQPSESPSATHQCYLKVTRPVAAGRTLISLPAALSLSVSSPKSCEGAFAGHYSALERFAQLLARELHNPHSPHRAYLEFLHDLHNTETGVAQDALLAEHHYHRAAVLVDQLDAMYAGNSLQARGAANAPFLDKERLTSANQRVEWVRLQQLQRRLEQGVPHFAAKSTAWALSMVLSRAMEDDAEELSLYPLIDFCAHSFEPNTYICVGEDKRTAAMRPVRWAESNGGPLIHVVTRRWLRAGEKVTLRWHWRPVKTTEDMEFWQMRFGYVPRSE
ncbi:conserved hypothetical protein [Leishmania braziliensis MHOM/BR/75/M2904]|uniref:Uncharacterized protein n=2 Tax=Leishmania braziliensis TaxID=5660 RepID=A4HB69_LEIBR|nr:conserved hypothetical protein [Leishmania braziliensis MHOM/BR/75/M2904]KAI5686581.1 hypothetical protein MNV84_03222 [Leishmania braziliensis]CAJ2471613.1 unnamed protein product [Leishmania braziliensis]CAM38655.1 conserved hypothetical protein [Leishmania braziliensis MHOM/BR/75/M2904]SYZ65358.1 hypothetical_protein [Leishmania braziliensis MHOM/BR/75/M2904]